MSAKSKKVAIGILGVTAIVLTAALLFVGNRLGIVSCSDRSALEGRGFNPDFAIAVIMTSDQKPLTYIDYYDEDLNLLASLEYPYLSARSPWGLPAIHDGVVFMTPRGKSILPNSSFVAALDMATGEVTEYDADGGVSNVAANDRYIFAAAQGGFGRIDRESGEVLSVDLDGRVFPFAYEDRLYVFNDMQNLPDEDDTKLLIYDVESLELIEEIFFGPQTAVYPITGFIGNRLYFIFAPDRDATSSTGLRNYLSFYSVEDAQIHDLLTDSGMRLYYVASIEGLLFVLATEIQSEDNIFQRLLIVDAETGEIKSVYPFDYFPLFILSSGNTLYIGGVNQNYASIIHSYIPDGDSILETGSIELVIHDVKGARYGIGGLFAPGE